MQSSIVRPRQWTPGIRPLLIVGVAALVAAGSYLAGGMTGGSSASPGRPAASVGLPADAPGIADGPLEEIDEAIGVWTGNLGRDRADFIAATNLAELYLARVRITADSADIARARDAASAALEANPNLLAAVLLRGQAHFANHEFRAAAADAESVLDARPGAPEALAALGDAQLELGDYDAARATYATLADAATGPAVDARRARLASLSGDLDGGRSLASAAASAARSDPDMRPETVAWYETLVGSLAFQDGDLDASKDAYRAALDAWDGSAAAMAGLARATAASGDLAEAIPLYEDAVAILPRPDTLAALGDLYALTGRDSEAEATYAKVSAVASLGPSDRQFALYEANHDGDAQRAVALARRELRTRHDVYAHDTLAWALFVAGRPDEAAAEIALARAQGTQDPLLDYHAGMIAAATGRSAEARALLGTLLERHPGFDPLQAARAAEAFAALGGRP
jgi:tetratricopeptide (TPR) repeat protein